MVQYASPLRYPGGKASLAPVLRDIRDRNALGSKSVGEPFAGGAGAALTLLMEEDTQEIQINDADPLIHDFWWALLKQPKKFLEELMRVPVTMDEWKRQREIHRNPDNHSRFERGFSSFYLNRCNRSGIIQYGGPIGGLEQKGKWGIDARFNRDALTERCERVIDYAERITIHDMDGSKFIQETEFENSFLFIDPPYYVKGPSLYMNSLTPDYHTKLAKLLQTHEDDAWVLTYDDCPEIRSLYADWARVESFNLRYSASKHEMGKEVCITPKWMALPEPKGSRTIHWNPSDT